MDKAIEVLLTYIESQMNSSLDGKSVLVQNLNEYMPQLYVYSQMIMNIAVKPIAYSILVFFLLLELQQIAQKMQSSNAQTYGMELFLKLFLKIGICSLIMRNIPTFLKAIMGIGISINEKILALNLSGGKTSPLAIAKIMDTVDAMKFFPQLFLALILFIVLLITMVVNIAVKVIIFMRFMELYVFMSVSPLPIATLPNDELGQIGKNFFKHFAAAALQGVLLYIVMSFVPIVINQSFDVSKAEGVMAISTALIGNSIALGMSLLATNRWSKSIATAA